MGLNYQDLELPVYRNTAEVMHFAGEKEGKATRFSLTLSDYVLAGELSGLNMLFISDVGRGKSQLVSDIDNAHFAGQGNKMKGRKDASVLDLFEHTSVDLRTGTFDSETARTLHTERVGRLLNIADELNRAPGPVQADFFDLADGTYTFRGEPANLGREGYALFLATMNLNKSGDNGFSGTFDVDRALYSRAHLTIDLDHSDFHPTAEDKLCIRSRGGDPRVECVEKKDLSTEILNAYKEIKRRNRIDSLDKKVFAFLIDDGLAYCEKDTLKHEKQGTWPMACLDCPHASKVCSSVKSSSERTVKSIARLAEGLLYVIELKYGMGSTISASDALLEAFRFTTYHGNLNDLVVGEKYNGRRQILMDSTIAKLQDAVKVIQPHMIDGKLRSQLIEFTLEEKGKITTTYDTKVLDNLKQRKVSHKILNLRERLKELGLGTDWLASLEK